MFPALVYVPHLGNVAASYQMMLLLAVVFPIVVGPPWAHRLERLDVRRLRGAQLILAPSAILGARLLYVLNNFEAYRHMPLEAFRIWSGGLQIAGAFLVIVTLAPVVFRAVGLPALQAMDGCAPTLGVSLAIFRFGCFLNGCCLGVPCQLPWCLKFPHSLTTVHPLPLYFALGALAASGAALVTHRGKLFHGQMALSFSLVLTLATAMLEFLRAELPYRPYWGPLPQLVWVSALIAVASGLALVTVRVRIHHSLRDVS